MNVERTIRTIAGAFILASLALGVEASPLYVTPHALWLAVFVGANLFQSGFTGFCPLELMLRRLGVRSGAPA
jgi:hypothetical protein